MRTATLLFFYLLPCCQATEILTIKRVILGQNVTLECYLDVKQIYWLFMKPSGSQVILFRTFNSESTSAVFHNQTLRNKYSSLTLSRLFIHNITVNELGIYYCAKPENSGLQVSNGTRLYINETARHNETKPQHQTTHQTLAITSLSIIVALFITIGLLTQKCGKTRKRPKPHQKFENLNLEEFTVVEFHLCE